MPAVMEAPRRSFVKQEESYGPSDSISPEWEAELAKRLKEVEDGTVECELFDETLRRAYERIAAIHAANMAFA